MKDIDLVKLKKLAQSATLGPWDYNGNCKYGVWSLKEECYVFMTGSHDDAYFTAAANPFIVLQLIDHLEAAERERDELRAIAEEQSKLAGSNAPMAQKAEAEIARRDAAAGERVATHLVYSSVLPKFIGDTDEVESYSCFISGETPPRKTMEDAYADAYQVCGPLYTAAQPAVLLQSDIDRIVPAIDPDGLDEAKHYIEHALYVDRERIRSELKAQVRQPFELNRSDVRSPMATRNSPRRVNSGLGVCSATSDHSSSNNHSSNGE